jgi:hypothetical protein
MKKLIFILFFLLSHTFYLSADELESWSQKSGVVGQELEYTFRADKIPDENIHLPELGFLSKTDSELPYAEILSINKQDGVYRIRVIFLESGEMGLPVSWKDESGKENSSESKINIQSSLTGNEKEILDITGPIEFNGFMATRILGIGLLFLAVITIFYYFFLKKKPKMKKANQVPMQIYEGEKSSHIWEKLESALQVEEYPHKEFVFLLSSAIKEQISENTNNRILHLTNKELMNFIKKQYKFADIDSLHWENYFSMIKYMPNEEMITREKANEKIQYWKKILRV